MCGSRPGPAWQAEGTNRASRGHQPGKQRAPAWLSAPAESILGRSMAHPPTGPWSSHGASPLPGLGRPTAHPPYRALVALRRIPPSWPWSPHGASRPTGHFSPHGASPLPGLGRHSAHPPYRASVAPWRIPSYRAFFVPWRIITSLPPWQSCGRTEL